MIFFNVEEARTQLVNRGLVFTLRLKERKRLGIDTAIFGSYYKHLVIGKVFIEFVKEIAVPIDLLPFVDRSGFKTVADWQEKANCSRFLYKVNMVDE